MSGRDPSSMSCEDLVVKVFLPNTKFASVQLEVTPTQMLVSAPQFLLELDLPQKVDDKQGNAKWLASSSVLEVVLPIVRGEEFFHPSQMGAEPRKEWS